MADWGTGRIPLPSIRPIAGRTPVRRACERTASIWSSRCVRQGWRTARSSATPAMSARSRRAAFSALAFAAVYLLTATVLVRRAHASWRLLIECFIAIGVGFATLAVPLALDAQWTSAVWALEGAGAFWVGMRQARWMPRAFGLVLQVVAMLAFMSGVDGGGLQVSPLPLANPAMILVSRLKIEGFIVSEHPEVWPDATKELGGMVATGKMKFRESVADGIASAPEAFLGLLKGKNFGKQLVKLS